MEMNALVYSNLEYSLKLREIKGSSLIPINIFKAEVSGWVGSDCFMKVSTLLT